MCVEGDGERVALLCSLAIRSCVLETRERIDSSVENCKIGYQVSMGYLDDNTLRAHSKQMRQLTISQRSACFYIRPNQ